MGRTKPVAAAALLVSACAAPTTYGYQYQLAQQFGGGEAPEPASHDARELLAGARTVAFYPPDYCVNNDPGHDATATERVLRANCGVLMSSLERAAEKAGYEVLSWQNLRGSKRPIDYAREANVDVLFEINELDLGTVDDSSVQRTMTFTERKGDGADAPLSVSAALAARCATYAVGKDPNQTAALSGTIDIKTVSVTDGRNRWRYRKTLSQSIGRTYPRVEFTAPPRQPTLVKVGAALGGVALGAGLGLLIIDKTSTDDPTTPQNEHIDTGDWPTILMVTGGVIAVAAIAGQALAPPQPADDVLCLDTPLVTGQVITPPATAAVVPAGPAGSSVTFQDSTSGDPMAKQREQIRNALIADFVGVLSDARRMGPSAPPPTAPAPAPATP